MLSIIMASAFSVFKSWGNQQSAFIKGAVISLKIIASIFLAGIITTQGQPHLPFKLNEDYTMLFSVIVVFFPKYVWAAVRTGGDFMGLAANSILSIFKK